MEGKPMRPQSHTFFRLEELLGVDDLDGVVLERAWVDPDTLYLHAICRHDEEAPGLTYFVAKGGHIPPVEGPL